MTYIMVVHGAKMKPNNGQRKLGKAACQISGLINHQMSIPARGPRKTKMVKKQHI
jgi:hypothetical protein